MDLSALIFVALAVAWAVYLIPKALRHHEEDQRSRTVDSFSTAMRVLASREPVDGRTARLVVPGRPAGAAVPAPAPPASSSPSPSRSRSRSPSPPPVRRSTAHAARRRRRVLGVVLLANLVVAALATAAVVAWPYVAIPGALLVGWLVACRLMVRSERGARGPAVRLPGAVPAPAPEVDDDGPLTEEIEPVRAPVAEEAEPVEGRLGPGPGHPPDLRHQGARRSPQRPHDRPRVHGRLDLGPQRDRQRPGARGRGDGEGRQGRARGRGRGGPPSRHRLLTRSDRARPIRLRTPASPGANVSPRLGLWRSW